jgi:hypothetical protein
MRWLFIILIFSACNPLRHYQKVALDDFRNSAERDLLAKAASEEFPITKGEPTTTVVYDSSAYNELMNKYNSLVQDYISDQSGSDAVVTEIDTVFLSKIRALKPATIVKTVTVEVPVNNPYVEEKLRIEVRECKNENDGLVIQAKAARESQKKTRTTNVWLYIVGGLLALGHIVRTKKLFA